MEEEMLFLLPVEKLHTPFFWKMSSFFFFLHSFGVVLWQGSEVPFCILWHWKFPQVCFSLSCPCSKHTHGHIQPLICPLPWNCHGALATKWFCGKWSVELRAGSSVLSHGFCEHVWFAELIFIKTWWLWLHTVNHCKWCLQSTLRNTVQGPWNYSLPSFCLCLVGLEWCG